MVRKMKNKIKIVASGENWIGIEKPWGMSVHNEPGRDVVSVLNTMSCQGRIPGFDPGHSSGIQPVHRLDKDTSGVLLLALSSDMTRRLSDAFQRNKSEKRYLALVHGVFEGDANPRKGTWAFPLSKEAGGRTNPAGKGRKVHAETRYALLEQSPHYALLDICLITGRKHQIRRHAKLAGHPITGDRRYGSKSSLEFLRKTHGYTRLGLHAASLRIKDKNLDIALVSGGLPPEMRVLLDRDKAFE